MDKVFTASYVKQNTLNFKISNLPNNRIADEYFPAYCIINNLLQRGKSVPASSELVNALVHKFGQDALDSGALDGKLTAIMRLQMTVLQLLMGGAISVSDKEWKFSVKTIDVSDYALLAIEDLLRWISNLFILMDINFTKPEITVKEVESFDETGYDEIKIFMDINSSNVEDINEFGLISVLNMHEQELDYFNMCTAPAVHYSFKENNEAKDSALRFFLKNIFGFDKFWPGQERIIKNALSRRDTIGVLPTGSGKSICYQLSALLQPATSICISPIKSLMIDQCQNLAEVSITRTAYISSDLTTKERDIVTNNFCDGKYILTYMAPERFQNENFREKLDAIQMSGEMHYGYFIIDEVHCMSEWGHSFRTSYLNLVKTARKYCNNPILLGLTATASENVLRNLKVEFGMKGDENVISVPSFTRDELEFSVINVNDSSNKFNELNKLLERFLYYHNDLFDYKGEDTKCGIIFTPFASEKHPHGCAKVAKALSNKYDIDVRCYAGEKPKGWSAEETWDEYKLASQKDFKENKYNLIVATKAFGTGIDKRNIRYSIHYGVPSSLESLYQEAGRAGRDKNNAQCIVLYKKESKYHRELLNNALDSSSNISELKRVSDAIGYKGEDLSRQVFLFANGALTYEEEMKCAIYILDNLKKHVYKIKPTRDFSREIIEKVVYHLSVIGVVDDWTVDWAEDIITVYPVMNYTFQSVCETVNKYIKNYAADSIIDPEDEYIKRNEVKFGDRKELLVLGLYHKWYNEKIISYRKQSLINVVEACERFESEGPVAFKESIESYFRLSDVTILISQVADNPDNYRNWFTVFSQAKASQTSMKELAMNMGRFLESFQNNVAIDFLSGLSNMLAGSFESLNGRRRLEQAMITINNYSEEVRMQILEETLKIVEEQNSDDINEVFSEFFVSNMDINRLEEFVYLRLHDNFSFKKVLESSMRKIAEYVR